MVKIQRAEGCVLALPAITVACYHQSFGLELSKQLRRVMVDMAAEHPKGFVTFTVANADSMNVRAYGDEQVRRELIALIEVLRNANAETIAVIEGSGFAAAALRAASMGLNLVTRNRSPLRVFTNVDDALHWLYAESAFKAAVPSRAVVTAALAEARRIALPEPVKRAV